MADTGSSRKRYRGKAVDVSFDPMRCRHAAECVRGLGAVFDTGRRPWVLPDGADPEDVVRVVARCPTGALRSHTIATTASEQPVAPTEVTALPAGPVRFIELELTPGDAVGDDQLAEAVASNLASYGHPTGTAPMGGPDDPWAVVDTHGAVRQLSGLRVVDASIIPVVPSVALNPTTIMIAERIATAVYATEPSVIGQGERR